MKDIIRWNSYILEEFEWSSSRANRVKAVLNGLGDYIEKVEQEDDEDLKDYRNLFTKFEGLPKEAVRKKSVFSKEEIDLIIDKLVENGKIQEACAIAFATSSGCRKSEIARIKFDWFSDENIIYDSFWKTPEQIVTKGKKGTTVLQTKYTLISSFEKMLNLWKEEREKLGIDSEWLFVKYNSQEDKWEQANDKTLDNFARYINSLEIVDKHFYWHSMRHWLVTYLSENKIPNDTIQSLFSWATSDMVNLYNDRDTAIDNLGEFFSKDGIKEVKKNGLSDL